MSILAAPQVYSRSGVKDNSLPEEVRFLAEAMSQRHGRVLISREKSGLHLNMACPACLKSEGVTELRKRHLAVNADKHLGLSKWGAGQMEMYKRDLVGLCMKCGTKYKVSSLLRFAPLSQRGVPDQVPGITFADNTRWLVDAPNGTKIPGGPGVDGRNAGVIPITQLPSDHPAAWYLLHRGYNLASLEAQMRVAYCDQEWPASKEEERYYRRMPGGFTDSPQGRIIFFCDIGGIQTSWQARIIDLELELNGVRCKAYWNGHHRQWRTMTQWNPASPAKDKFELLPHWKEGDREFSPSKYRTANGTERNEVLFGLDAAVRWNKLYRPDQIPVAFVTEGPLDAGRIGPPAVARIGKYLSDPQINLLAKHFGYVVLVPDNDAAGRHGLEEDLQRLSAKLSTEVWHIPEQVEGVTHKIKDVGDLPDWYVQKSVATFLQT